MTANLPGANYNAPIGDEDLIFEQGVYRDEFLERMRLVFGHPDFISVASWGIVAETDPSTVTTSSLEPLVVTSSALTLSIRAGLAVTKSGHRIYIPNGIVEKGVATSEENAVNVVTAKFYTTDPEEQTPDVYGDPVFRTRVLPDEEDRVVVYTLAQWNALTLTEQADHVPLALATVILDSGGEKALTITHYSTSNTWLRPWFSPVDIEHRSMVGSGTVSYTNPHGNSVNDFAIGNFTFPQLMSHIGMVVAQDKSVPNVPGTVCSTAVPAGLIKTDDGSGTVTGIPGAKYIDLGFYPTALGEVYDDSGDRYVFVRKPKTTIIYQPASSYVVPASTDLTVMAARATALEPPAGENLINFEVGSIGTYEAVLASGQVLVSGMSITRTDQLSSDAGPIPAFYRFYFADSQIVKNPQVILCSTKVSDITGSGITPSVTQFGRGIPLVAMNDAAAGASLSVKVRITGTDTTGAAASEVLTLGSSWSEPASIPSCSTHYPQWVRGTTVFATITNISLDEALNAGDLAEIQVWVLMDPTTTPELSYAALVAEGQWDGVKLCTLKDLRRVHYDLQLRDNLDPGTQAVAACRLIPEPGGTRRNMYVEDFRRPYYGALSPIEWTGLYPDIIWNSDRTSGRLDQIYESRALHFPNGASYFMIVFAPYLFTENQISNQTYIYWSAQNSAGTWSAWQYAYNSSSSNYIQITPAANTRALRLRVWGWDLTGMVVIEYT